MEFKIPDEISCIFIRGIECVPILRYFKFTAQMYYKTSLD